MKVFIVAIPFFDSSMAVAAYRLCDQSGDKALSVKNDFRGRTEALLSPGLDIVEKVGIEPFAGEMPLFVEINKLQLLMGMPTGTNIPSKKLVCLIPGSIPVDKDVLERCRVLKELGYSIALDKFPLNGVQSSYLNYADYMLLQHDDLRFADILRTMAASRPKVRIIIDKVPNMAAFEQLGADKLTADCLFAGSFYRQPITKGISKISPVKVNALQLLKHVNEPDFDLADIAKIIERDPALSISLLRFINSQAVGVKRKIDSIQSAVAILGQQELRRWATVAISVSLADDRPGEITKLSLVRAKFAEILGPIFELGVFQNQLFMAGLFSLLDVILQKPMVEAIAEVSVDQRVFDALVLQKGELYRVLEFIYAYEHADWDRVSIMQIQNGLGAEETSKAFVDALIWYDQLLQSIDSEEEADEDDD